MLTWPMQRVARSAGIGGCWRGKSYEGKTKSTHAFPYPQLHEREPNALPTIRLFGGIARYPSGVGKTKHTFEIHLLDVYLLLI